MELVPPTNLLVRRLELERRVEALPDELERWRTRTLEDLDHNSHYSQMEAIRIMMEVFVDKQRKLLSGLDPTGDAHEFGITALNLIGEIIKAQRTWDFFRDKLDLRFYPDFKEPLAIADTVAWDCYKPTLNEAHRFGILTPDRFREPPLTYLTAEFSPATWVRGSRPSDGRDYSLGTAKLPIPVIEIPWDSVVNYWEFLLISHEVGHDIEADLALRQTLLNSLAKSLRKAGVPSTRIRVWLAWEGETFADLVGLQLAGPAFGDSMLNILLLPREDVTRYDENDPHPTHYLRILMNAAYIRTLLPGNSSLDGHASRLENTWTQMYGAVDTLGGFSVGDLKNDFQTVFGALMDTPFDALGGHTVRELMPYTPQDDAIIRMAANFLSTGMNRPARIRPRHVISASRLAASEIAQQPDSHGDKLKAANERTAELLKANTELGLRAAEDSTKHRAFIQGLAQAL